MNPFEKLDREALVVVGVNEMTYGMDLMQDIARVKTGEKPLAIGSTGKCLTATCAAYDIAKQDPELHVQLASLVCEDGEYHWHVFVCREGAPYADEAIRLILRASRMGRSSESPHAAGIIRRRLQLRLGLLLGYAAQECVEFSASEIGRTCVCDCCGGPATAEEPPRRAHDAHDQHIRRTGQYVSG